MEDERVEVVYAKWPDRPHYEFSPRVLGVDKDGTWLACDAGDEVRKAGAVAFVRAHPLLFVVPRGDEWWSAYWYPPSVEEFEVYVNINTAPVWTDGRVTMIDVDLDVEKRRDGAVLLLDEDEFAVNQAALAYPPDVVAAGVEAAGRVMAMLDAGAEPFATRWRPWLARCLAPPPDEL